jgi:hypothetical protein
MMIGKFTAGLCTAAVVAGSAMMAQALPVSPVFDTFGDLPGATFGGSGIQTDPTAITEFTGLDGDLVTFGLAATRRFNNPVLGHDGAGTYSGVTGANDGTPGSTVGGAAATWNFSFYINVDSNMGNTIADYGVSLLYDLDPGVGTDDASLGIFDFSALSIGLAEGSQNATFGFLSTGGVFPGVTITAPGFSASNSFNPNAIGEYSFAIRSSVFSEDVAINLNVAPVPVPAAALFLITGIGGLAVARRRRARA